MNIEDFNVKTLGKCTVESPLKLSKVYGDDIYDYVTDEDRVLYDPTLKAYKDCLDHKYTPVSFEKAGPREFIYFDPSKTKAAIVTCGGLCPGLNDVIRGLVNTLHYRYNVNSVFGIRYGYEGFIPKYNHPVMELTIEKVENIQMMGGTILGSSRGNQDVGEIVDALERMNINILFTIGGDGTQAGAYAIHEEIEKRNLKISVIGIPKTIDNDISYIERSFGFETAFTKAFQIITDAHNEAKGAYNGIALIKLMGRDSGFIAANATLASQEVNFILVPEQEFDFYGPNGFISNLKARLERKKHAVIVVAEGAGQHLFNEIDMDKDASGNVLHHDIGLFLKEKMKEELKNQGVKHTIKYIDPSYIIRSAPANANDSKFCLQLSQSAVHAAMCGKTACIAGVWNNHFTHVPIPVSVKQRKKIELESELWYNVMEVTGQPLSMKNK